MTRWAQSLGFQGWEELGAQPVEYTPPAVVEDKVLGWTVDVSGHLNQQEFVRIRLFSRPFQVLSQGNVVGSATGPQPGMGNVYGQNVRTRAGGRLSLGAARSSLGGAGGGARPGVSAPGTDSREDPARTPQTLPLLGAWLERRKACLPCEDGTM